MTTIQFARHNDVALTGDIYVPDGAGFNARNAVIQGWGHYWMATSPDDPATASYLFAPRLLRFLEDNL